MNNYTFELFQNFSKLQPSKLECPLVEAWITSQTGRFSVAQCDMHSHSRFFTVDYHIHSRLLLTLEIIIGSLLEPGSQSDLLRCKCSGKRKRCNIYPALNCALVQILKERRGSLVVFCSRSSSLNWGEAECDNKVWVGHPST